MGRNIGKRGRGDIMTFGYEIVNSQDGFPVKAFIHSVDGFKMHWHDAIEILLILKGSVSINVGNERFLLRENDLILINSNEIHNTNKTDEDNIILALQINPAHYTAYHPQINRMLFDCKSFIYREDEQERFDVIRWYLAQIVWEFNKQTSGYQFTIGSKVNLLISHLMNHFTYTVVKNENVAFIRKDIERIQRIISYINENLESKITLKEIAEIEHLSLYYLSHFIKKHMGMSFQEYLNHIRLDKSVKLLTSTDKTITEISYKSGFPSTKSFNKLFKDIYNLTPTEFRKQRENPNYISKAEVHDIGKVRSKTYLDVDRSAAFKSLFQYLDLMDKKAQKHNMAPTSTETISAKANEEGEYLEPYWKKLTSFGRAAEGLRQGWQNQLKELQDELGFEYIRFHGIFSDEMMVYNIGNDGNVVYNWSYVDELFDFFKKINIKPFVELGFMPSEIKSSDETIFWWNANISQPKDIKLWTDLVKEFIKHCINRYGLKEVETWYFEVWNEPELEYVFWIGGKESYFNFYKETVLAIKSISPKFRVGGPSITHQVVKEGTWLEDFLDYCNSNNAPLDFISLHIYPEDFSSKEEVEEIMIEAIQKEEPLDLMSIWGSVKRIYYDKNHTHDTLSSANSKINKYLIKKPELHITEWNASTYCRNLINDTCFSATFIISNILENIGNVDFIGHWTFTDIMEEFKAGISHFHGGFGLINKEGLKKPSYFAYYLLSKLGNRIIGQGEEYVITKRDEDIQVLAYNYAYLDELFSSGDTSALTNTQRYLVFEDKPTKEVKICISGLSGYYKITRYQLNREHGSVVDAWIDMGAPENMTEEELKYLKGKAMPKMTVEYSEIEGDYKDKLFVPVHGVELVLLEKKIK